MIWLESAGDGMADEVECVVAGAGVVGLAIARALAQAGREVLVLEGAESFGTGVSARNSEVIHAGIYYAPGSLMAQACVAGREALYEYCAQKGVGHRRCEKLIVATTEEEAGQLAGIAARAAANGVVLERLSEAQALRLEPALQCKAALLSPATGIVDSHGLMLALLGDVEAAGGGLACHSPVAAVRIGESGFEIKTGGETPYALRARVFVNAAGLGAVALAGKMEGLDQALVPKLHLAKGNYFGLAGRAPFGRLIYPVPVPGGLGVHLTLDLGGQARFGPDVEWIEAVDYEVDPARGEKFYASIRRYWPELADGALSPAYAGIRPKISGPGEAARDFMVQGPEAHGVPGLVNLFGIESPGLTSSLALAEIVQSKLGV